MSTKFGTTIALCFIYFAVGWTERDQDQLYMERFELIQLPKLKTKSVQQNLEFRVGKTMYNFTLLPRSAIITPNTNISLISTGNRTTTLKMDPTQFSRWNFDGFMVNNHTVTISGSVNRLGQFEGYIVQDGDIYLLEPTTGLDLRGQTKKLNRATNDDDSSILVKISDICRRVQRSNEPVAKIAASDDGKFKICDDRRVLSRRRNADLNAESAIGEMMKQQQKQHRQSSASNSINGTYLCNLKIVLDYRFYKYVGKSDRNHSVAIVVNLMSNVDKLFRKIDFNDDGRPDNVGFYIDDLAIYKDPVKYSYNQTSSWDATRFFQEMKEYDFSGACAGLLFTFREMQTAEENSPSLIKTQLVSDEQGICSSRQVTVPRSSMADYGEYIGNALPVNFLLGGSPAKEATMISQVLHQLGHLFGAPNDDFYSDEDDCCKKMIGRSFVMGFPVPPGDKEDHFTYSPCSIMAMANFLSKSTRPCLRSCEGPSCDRPLLGMKPSVRLVGRNMTSDGPRTAVTMASATRDWTEYCFTVPRNEAGTVALSFYVFMLLIAFAVAVY